MKGKTYNQEYSTQQDSHSDLMERLKKFYRQAKPKSSAPLNQLYKKCLKDFSKQNRKGDTRNMKL